MKTTRPDDTYENNKIIEGPQPDDAIAEVDEFVSTSKEYNVSLSSIEHVYSPLHEAVLNGDLDILSLLIDHGAQTNIQDNSGSTPLHWAAKLGHESVVSLLLRQQSAPTMLDANAEGLTPLRLAIRNGHGRIVKMLLDAGVDANGCF